MSGASRRLIPVLLLDSAQRLVKTVAFGERTYVGDPFNIIRIFNDKEVDEICILDIDAGPDHRGPNVEFIAAIASECFMPLAYGGGLSRLEDLRRLNRVGVEKFVLGRAVFDESFLREAISEFGSQAIVACIDFEHIDGREVCWINGRREMRREDPLTVACRMQDLGVGEIFLQSVARDGTRIGYDCDVISRASRNLKIPVIAAGGAGDIQDLKRALISGASAAASGTAFSFIGPLRAVLVTYPTSAEREALGL